MILKSLTISNHQSIGNIEIADMPAGLVHVTGIEQGGDANRSGKTAFIEAIIKALYGTCPRGSGKVAGFISGIFEIAGKIVESRVSWSAAGAHKWKLTIDGEPFSGMKECLTQIESLIGLTYDEFTKLGFLQKSCDNLTKAEPGERADMAIKFLGIREHNQAIATVRHEIDKVDTRLSQANRELDIANAMEIPDQEKIEATERELEALRAEVRPLAHVETEYQNQINVIEPELKKLTVEIQANRSREAKYIDAAAKISGLRTSLTHSIGELSDSARAILNPAVIDFTVSLNNAAALKTSIENGDAIASGLRTTDDVTKAMTETNAVIESLRAGISDNKATMTTIQNIIRLGQKADELKKSVPENIDELIAELLEIKKNLEIKSTIEQKKIQSDLAILRSNLSRETNEGHALDMRITRLTNQIETDQKKLDMLQKKDGVECPLSGQACPVIPEAEIARMIESVQNLLKENQTALDSARKLKDISIGDAQKIEGDIAEHETMLNTLVSEISVLTARNNELMGIQTKAAVWREAVKDFTGAIEQFGESNHSVSCDQAGIDDLSSRNEKDRDGIVKLVADIEKLRQELNDIRTIENMGVVCGRLPELYNIMNETEDAKAIIETLESKHSEQSGSLKKIMVALGETKSMKATIIQKGMAMKERLDSMLAMKEKAQAKDSLIAEIDRLTIRRALLVETVRFYQLLPIYEFGAKLAGLESLANHFCSILTNKFSIRFRPVKEFKTSANVKFQWVIMLEDELGERLIDHKHPEASGAELDVINFSIKSALLEMFASMTGKRPGIMPMDEPFTSYSDQKVDAFLNYLTSTMAQKYNQIFLVAHDPRIKETLENVATISLFRSSGAGSGIKK